MNPVSFFGSPWVNALAWAGLAAIVPAIIALYFLKLKRQPLEVPSTYLWSRTIEDLHVNSLWQRLRKSLLLLLQLLLIALVIVTCLRLGWRGSTLTGDRFIFMIDNSASMNAVDISPNRLAEAKRLALQMIDQLKSGDAAMIISFSDEAFTEQSFTNKRALLRQSLNNIKPTNRTTNISEALRAASGLANPGRTGQDATDVQVAEAMPAAVYIFSDGGFPAVEGFRPGNLTLNYVKIGVESPKNVGITQFNTSRNPEHPGELEAFVHLENSGLEDAAVEVALHLDGEAIDFKGVNVPKGEGGGVQFKLQNVDEARLKVEAQYKDDLLLDNVAYAAVNRSRPARVLVISPGGLDSIRFAASTDEAIKVAEVSFALPAYLQDEAYLKQADAGAYDLVIYDRCRPERMPQANTLFIGQTPPVEGWSAGEKTGPPIIIDHNPYHPLTRYLTLGDVLVYEGFEVRPPQGGVKLIDADIGALFAVAPRIGSGYEDAVLGIQIYGVDRNGEEGYLTNWQVKRSFPIFVMNVLRYLGRGGESAAMPSVKPGRPVELRPAAPVANMTVQTPSGERVQLARGAQGSFIHADTGELGLYSAFEGDADKSNQLFAVNLFDVRESNITPAVEIYPEKEGEAVQALERSEPARTEVWKWVLIGGMAVLLFEWYVYNRRVYL